MFSCNSRHRLQILVLQVLLSIVLCLYVSIGVLSLLLVDLGWDARFAAIARLKNLAANYKKAGWVLSALCSHMCSTSCCLAIVGSIERPPCMSCTSICPSLIHDCTFDARYLHRCILLLTFEDKKNLLQKVVHCLWFYMGGPRPPATQVLQTSWRVLKQQVAEWWKTMASPLVRDLVLHLSLP